MNKNKSTWIWVLGIAVVLTVLFMIPRFTSKQTAPGVVSSDSATDVPCLVPNIPLKQHVHPQLTITVDGVKEEIPANIGLTVSCERALHTHDATGELHVEAQDDRAYTLGEFFSVWERKIEREGYTLNAQVDGVSVTTPIEAIPLKDGEKIELLYTTPKK